MSLDGLKVARLQDIGCLACLQDGRVGVPSDMHHPVAGYRVDDKVVVPLCAWHHRGVMMGDPDEVARSWGPSLALHRRAFRARYGTDAQLLELAEEIMVRLFGSNAA